MTTVLASVSPLSRPPVPYEELREYRPDYLSAYDVILNAERLAKEQVEADPSNREVSCSPDWPDIFLSSSTNVRSSPRDPVYHSQSRLAQNLGNLETLTTLPSGLAIEVS